MPASHVSTKAADTPPQVILLRNCQIYAPALLKETAVMLGGGNIAALLDDAAAGEWATRRGA